MRLQHQARISRSVAETDTTCLLGLRGSVGSACPDAARLNLYLRVWLTERELLPEQHPPASHLTMTPRTPRSFSVKAERHLSWRRRLDRRQLVHHPQFQQQQQPQQQPQQQQQQTQQQIQHQHIQQAAQKCRLSRRQIYKILGSLRSWGMIISHFRLFQQWQLEPQRSAKNHQQKQ